MNCHYDYFLRLSTFRNIDLPLQGVYFLQFKVNTGASRTVIVPYAGSNGNTSDDVTLHNLFPPQIAHDDSMQSTGFIVQFSDEDVSLTDAFRISIKDEVDFVTKSGELEIHSMLGSAPLIVSIDLLFSNASDVGGLESIIKSPSTSEFPSEFVVVASQRIILNAPNCSQYFRSPLALLREYDTEEEEEAERESGDIFPCAFLEGVVISSCIKLELDRQLYSADYSNMAGRISDDLNVHPVNLRKSILHVLEDARKFHDRLIADLGVESKLYPIPESPTSAQVPNQYDIVSDVDRLSSVVFITWNRIIDNFPPKMRRNMFRSEWRTFLLGKSQTYTRSRDSSRSRQDLLTGSPMEMFTFPLARNCVPILYSDTIQSAQNFIQSGHGAHLIVLVHGYQGTTNDMRLIRNTIACLCPEALIFSSSANEGQTDGDIETMGARLAMELKDFISQHSNSFSIINRISFVGHSLGGLIIRAAIPLLSDYQEKLHVYISLSTPHLGISNKLIEGGVAFLRLFKKAELLEQLTLKDSVYLHDSFLYRLSNIPSFNWFRRIILVGSWQDQYAPLSTASICPAADDRNALTLAKNIRRNIGTDHVITVDVDFDIEDGSSLDSVIGRAAHIKFLESPVLIQLLILINEDMFEI